MVHVYVRYCAIILPVCQFSVPVHVHVLLEVAMGEYDVTMYVYSLTSPNVHGMDLLQIQYHLVACYCHFLLRCFT